MGVDVEQNLFQITFTERDTINHKPTKTMNFVHPKQPLKKRITISFSGGKTSAMMTKLLLDNLSDDYDIIITFANTSQEHPKTYEFVDRCDKELFGNRVVWLEAVVHHGERRGCTHKVVNFATAKRNGEVMEDVIKKYGLPNQIFTNCNREMKINTMRSYIRSLGWKQGTYSTAVGIRNDEIDRVSIPSMKNGIFYPCIDNNIRKEDVRLFWEAQNFNLEIPEHYGNCVTCFKKSHRKLLTIAQDDTKWFDFFLRMGRDHIDKGARAKESPRKIFRKHTTTLEMLELARKGDFKRFVDGHVIDFDPNMDIGGGCGAGCEIGADGCDWDDFNPIEEIIIEQQKLLGELF